MAVREGTDRPAGPVETLTRTAGVPLAVALALTGQFVLSRPGGLYRSLLPGAALLALATAVHARASESCQLQGCQGRCGHPRTGV